MPEEDLWTHPDWLAFQKHALEEMVPALKDSALNVSLCPPDEGDPKFWIELGASIMFDKTIVVVVRPGQAVPPGLRRVATKVLIVDADKEADREKFATYLQNLLGERGIE